MEPAKEPEPEGQHDTSEKAADPWVQLARESPTTEQPHADAHKDQSRCSEKAEDNCSCFDDPPADGAEAALSDSNAGGDIAWASGCSSGESSSGIGDWQKQEKACGLLEPDAGDSDETNLVEETALVAATASEALVEAEGGDEGDDEQLVAVSQLGKTAPADGYHKGSHGWRALRRRWTTQRSRSDLAAPDATHAGAEDEGGGGGGGGGQICSYGADCVGDSEHMVALESRSPEEGEPEDASTCGADSWMIVDREGVVVAEDNGCDYDPLAPSSVEAKVEQLLTWMLAPAVHGIPKLGVPGAVDRAEELLLQYGRDVEAAVREVVAGSESTVCTQVLHFCLERIPVLGCPTVLLRMTWGNLRSILIIAALYGHDLEAPRVQHEALLCLVPPGEDEGETEVPVLRSANSSAASPPSLVRDTAQKVARSMIKGALRRATGLQAAVDCFELASLLYNWRGQETVDEDGFVHVLATPASAARDLFRRKSFASCALLWCSLPLLVVGMLAPALFVAARWVPTGLFLFRSLVARLPLRGCQSLPAALLGTLGLALAIRSLLRLVCPARGRRRGFWNHQRRRPKGSCMAGLERRARALQQAWPQVVTMTVFSLHAGLPAISTYSAVAVILSAFGASSGGVFTVDMDAELIEDDGVFTIQPRNGWDTLHRLAGLALGLYSLCAVVSRHVRSERPELEAADAPRFVLLGFRILHAGWAAARACCVLAAWTYGSAALDLSITYVARRGGQLPEDSGQTVLGVIGPLAWIIGADRNANPLNSEQALAFSLQFISLASQQRLVELLGRREVLLRLIGAERVMASTLCLLLKGVAVACSNAKSGANPIAEFLTSVAPPPMCCVLVAAIRSQAVLLGAALVLAPRIAFGGWLGSAACFLLGIWAGAYAAYAVLSVWFANRADLDSPALRLALLVPGGVSGRAKGLLRGALAGARTRAVQMMAMGIIERAFRWLWRKL